MRTQYANSGRRPLVLLVGSEQILLSTRKAILEREGLLVLVTDPAYAIEVMEKEQPDLVITCHTLELNDARDIAASASRMPRPPGLLKFTRPDAPGPATGFDRAVDAMDPPLDFVQSVCALLASA